MSIELRFLAAVVRKADIDSHYPGGLPAFERHQVVAVEDDHLVALFAMSGSEIQDAVPEDWWWAGEGVPALLSREKIRKVLSSVNSKGFWEPVSNFVFEA